MDWRNVCRNLAGLPAFRIDLNAACACRRKNEVCIRELPTFNTQRV
jgi:hypothetical protein